MFADERVSTRSPHSFRNTSAFGVDDEISSSSVERGSGNKNTRFDPRDLRAARSDDHERTCREGSCAFVRVDTAAGNDKSVDPVVEGEDIVQVVGRISAFAEAILGTPPVGAWVLLL